VVIDIVVLMAVDIVVLMVVDIVEPVVVGIVELMVIGNPYFAIRQLVVEQIVILGVEQLIRQLVVEHIVIVIHLMGQSKQSSVRFFLLICHYKIMGSTLQLIPFG